MKQRLYNWIYRTLRRFGIKSTEHVNLNDYFYQALEISGGNVFVQVKAEIKRYKTDGEIVTEFSVYDEVHSHFYASSPDKAIMKYKVALDEIGSEPESVEV